MRKIRLLFLFLLSPTLMAATHHYLFFQTATMASLSQNKDKSYTLTINNPTNRVSYFTNRPTRQSGTITIPQFVKLWSNPKIRDNFSEVPPNVAITVTPKKGQTLSFIAVVSKPHYMNHQLSYTLILEKPAAFKHITAQQIDLFFDDIHWNPGGF